MEIKQLHQKYLECGKVSTDTRQITPGSVFFALKGATFDANQFAAEAIAKGASFAVVDDPAVVSGDKTILVKDVLQTLQDLARYHRSKLSIPVIGLTGSNGKTTTKELIAAALGAKFRTFATRGNLNNHIGVPVSILSITPETEMAVIEMGANHVGEIAMLCEIANPTHGLITNIGKAHLGTFGGFENIVRGKTELYQHLLDHGGTAFINSANSILAPMIRRFKSPVLYPSPGNFLHCEFLGANPNVKFKSESGKVIETNLVGAYNFENFAAALCIAKFFGVEEDKALAAVAGYKSENMRSQIVQKGDNTIILDAYNANPSSMEAALINLSQMKGSLVAIIGDMYELEDEAAAEHRKIGELIRRLKLDDVWFCGPMMRDAFVALGRGRHFSTRDELIAALRSNPFHNKTILIKASRGMALEKISDYI